MSSDPLVRIIRIKNANGSEKMLEIPAKLDLERPKRPRTIFTEEQLEKLEHAFTASGYLSGATRSKLAESLGLSDNQVKVWFQNRRTKQKKIESREPEKPTTPSSSGSKIDYGLENLTFYQHFWSQHHATFFSSTNH